MGKHSTRMCQRSWTKLLRIAVLCCREPCMQRVSNECIVGLSSPRPQALQAVSLRNGSRRGRQGGEEDRILVFLQYKLARYIRTGQQCSRGDSRDWDRRRSLSAEVSCRFVCHWITTQQEPTYGLLCATCHGCKSSEKKPEHYQVGRKA